MTIDQSLAFSVATYNIHRCVGSDGRKDPARIATMIEELSCDIVGLQEVESHGARGSDAHQLDYLSHHGGFRSIAGPTMKRAEGHYGNALLTKARVREVTRHSFDSTGREPRGALEAHLELHGRPVRTIVTHLGLRPSERRAQVERIVDIVDRDSTATTILMGDFNEWFPWARSRRRLRTRFGRFSTPATFPSRWPLFALDHVCIRPASRVTTIEPIRTPLSRVASDHLPLRASVSFDPR